MRKIFLIVIILVLFISKSFAQENNKIEEHILTFEEYLGYVKKHHPLIKKANLKLTIGEANLLKSRGGFDPRIEIDYKRKYFNNTEYYNQLNSTFKIPTWYGIELKANFEDNTGDFLNPNLKVPENGLYSAGVSFSLAQGLLINERMAMLKKAKFYIQQTKSERELLVNNIIFDASKAYFNWLEAYNEMKIHKRFMKNALFRYNAVKRNIEIGEKAAIDSVEAKITLQNRRLNLEATSLKTKKALLKASNFLWVNNLPLEISSEIYPITPDKKVLTSSLMLESLINQENFLINHPKIKSIRAKVGGLKVEQSLKRNKLLPKLDFQYNFLTSNINEINNFNISNNKAFVNLSFPLFLRKERGGLQLAKLKLKEANFSLVSETLTIKNKVDALNEEIYSLKKQHKLITNIVADYEALLNAEERKFVLGESSLFLVNSREQKLINSELKANIIKVKVLKANINLFNTFGLSNMNVN